MAAKIISNHNGAIVLSLPVPKSFNLLSLLNKKDGLKYNIIDIKIKYIIKHICNFN